MGVRTRSMGRSQFLFLSPVSMKRSPVRRRSPAPKRRVSPKRIRGSPSPKCTGGVCYLPSPKKNNKSVNTDVISTVATLVRANPSVIFTKSGCKYCTMAKSLFRRHKIQFAEIDLAKRFDGAEIAAALQDITGQRTVPNIFVRGAHIGGYTDFKNTFL